MRLLARVGLLMAYLLTGVMVAAAWVHPSTAIAQEDDDYGSDDDSGSDEGGGDDSASSYDDSSSDDSSYDDGSYDEGGGGGDD